MNEEAVFVSINTVESQLSGHLGIQGCPDM